LKSPAARWICVLALLVFSSHAPAQSKEALYQGDHAAMGTTYTIYLYAPDPTTAQSALEAAFDEIDRVDDLLSNYKSTSEISRINREAAQHAVITDAETFAFLQAAMAYSRNTGGTFDITVGRLLHTWGFFQHQGAVPSAAAQHADASGVGWQHVHLDPATRSVQFLHSNQLELDPGGIGKGYAVDRVVALLHDLHITRALISAGSSSLYMIGAPPGEDGWPVQIPDPTHPGVTLQTLHLHDVSLSTSACSEKHFVQNGHDYCHIFDPRTLVPVEGMLQTTIISPLAIDSDALSTGLFVTTPEQSRTILDQHYPGIAALILSGDKASFTATSIHWPEPIPSPKGPAKP